MDPGLRSITALWGVALLGVAVVLTPPAGSGAFYTDADSAGNNSISGGTLDPKLSEVGPTTQGSTTDETAADSIRDTWEDASHPTDGSEFANNTVELSNAESSLPADRVNVSITYVENDSGGTGGNADNTATTVEVASFVYGGSELVGTDLTDQNGNGFVDVADLTGGTNADNLSTLGGVAAGDATTIELSLSGQATLLDGVALGDGLDVDVSIAAHRVSYVDEDTSTNNTIIYG